MKRISQAILAALGVALAGSASAYWRDGTYFDYARVDRVEPVMAIVDAPRTRQECWTEPRTEYHPTSEVRTEVVDRGGAVPVVRREIVETGGYSTTTDERICRTNSEQATARQVIGYDVVYTYRGDDYRDRLDHDPGAAVRIRVDHGYVETAE